ncbi:unnamed protein product [Closterium sp. NIES-54]
MASLRVLAFDHEGRPVAFDTWHDDLQLYLLSNIKDGVSLFDHVSGVAPAPPATADGSTRSQWLSRDATARLAIRNHLPVAVCTHFGQHRTAQALYDTVVARYSSPATGALGRLLQPYLCPELSSFAIVADLVTYLRTSDALYRATIPAEFLDTSQPPMFITLYFIVSRLPDSLRSVRDHFLSLDPTSLTVDLLEQHPLAAQTSAVAVGAACGTPCPPFFEGCSPSPLSPSFASAAAADVSVPEDVGAASTSAKRRSSKAKGGGGGSGGGGGGSGGGGGGSGGGGGGSRSGGGGSGGGGGGSGGGGGGGSGGGSGSSGGGYGDGGGSGGSGGGGSGGGRSGPRRGGPGGGQRQQQQRRSETQSPQQLREWLVRRGTGGGIAVAALGTSASGTPPGTAPAEALHTFTLDSCASCCFFRDSTTLTPLPAPFPVRLADLSGDPVVARSSTVLPCPAVPSGSLSGLHLPSFSTNLVSTAALQDAMVTTTTPGGQRVSICTCTWTGRLLATFTRRPGLSLYTLATKPPQVAASLPPLLPSPAPPYLPCIEGRQRAAPHSSSFPLTTAPLHTLHMDVWGPVRVSGQGCERYFLLVNDDYSQYTTVFPLRSKGEVVDVLIPWIRTVRLHLREHFGTDLPVLRLHSDKGGEFSSDLLRDFCRGEGILQSFTLPASPQQNGIAERRIGLVMEVARTSMIHATAPHFLWPFADVPFDESVPFYCLFPYRSAPPPPPPLFLAPGPPPVDPLPPQGPAPSGVSQGAEPGGAGSEGAGSGGAEPWGAEPEGVEPRGAESEGAESRGAEPRGAALSGGPAGASPRLSSQQLRDWLVRRAHRRSGAPGVGGARDTRAGGAAVPSGAGGTGGAAATGPGGACTSGARAAGTGGVGCAGAGDPTELGVASTGGAGAGVGGPGEGGARVAGAGVRGTGAGGAGSAGAGAVDPDTGVFSPLPAPSPYTEQSGGLTKRREPASHPVSPVRTARRAPRLRPPSVPGTHSMALRPSSVPLRVPLPTPPESSLPEVPDPESDRARADSPTVSRLLATAVTDPSFESASASALVAELLDFANACRLDYAPALAAMDAEMASWKSTGTYVDEVPPPGANIVDGMWIFRVKQSPGSPPAFKARYVARGFSQRQGVEYFHTFSPTPKMTTLRVLLHIAAQRDYELHSLDFSTAFLQGSLHEEIWLRRPPGFTGTFPTGTQWSLRRPVYGLRQAPREWHDTMRTTLAALGFAPSTADPSLFLRTNTSLPPF